MNEIEKTKYYVLNPGVLSSHGSIIMILIDIEVSLNDRLCYLIDLDCRREAICLLLRGRFCSVGERS
jgi:hypothetical protein